MKRQAQIILQLAVDDAVSASERTFLGLFWEPLSYCVVLVVLGPLYARIMGIPLWDYMVYFASGWFAWKLLSGFVTHGCTTFWRHRRLINDVNLPMWFYPFSQSITQFMLGLLVLPVLALLLVWKGDIDVLSMVMLVPALFVLLATGFALAVILGYLSVVIRDTHLIVDNAMRILFFVTPVIWQVESLATAGLDAPRVRALYVDLNPVYHYLEVVRSPLMGQDAAMMNWLVVLGLTLLLSLVAAYILGTRAHLIAYHL